MIAETAASASALPGGTRRIGRANVTVARDAKQTDEIVERQMRRRAELNRRDAAEQILGDTLHESVGRLQFRAGIAEDVQFVSQRRQVADFALLKRQRTFPMQHA